MQRNAIAAIVNVINARVIHWDGTHSEEASPREWHSLLLAHCEHKLASLMEPTLHCFGMPVQLFVHRLFKAEPSLSAIKLSRPGDNFLQLLRHRHISSLSNK